jgi:hypothetical protein
MNIQLLLWNTKNSKVKIARTSASSYSRAAKSRDSIHHRGNVFITVLIQVEQLRVRIDISDRLIQPLASDCVRTGVRVKKQKRIDKLHRIGHFFRNSLNRTAFTQFFYNSHFNRLASSNIYLDASIFW